MDDKNFLPALPPRQQAWVVSLSVGLFYLTMDLIRRRKIREDESWLWLLVGTAIFLLGTQYRLLRRISELFGIGQPSSTIFLLGQLFFILLQLQTSIKHSQNHLIIKNLVQELAISQKVISDIQEKLDRDIK
ncbi:MAG: DUF2304 domain-containing protein [Candidatus Riflebacteria bacterium]|nr:DUF2304 domain-containing protein [Candidatus Riflebacteria bacterium]